MFGEFDKYNEVFLVGLLVNYFLTPLVREMACRFGIVDVPSERRPHKRPMACRKATLEFARKHFNMSAVVRG